MKIRLIAIAALVLPAAAYAHPGHGTTPASDGNGKPHVHFGTPHAPSSAPKALPSGDKRVVDPARATGAKRTSGQELSHTR